MVAVVVAAGGVIVMQSGGDDDTSTRRTRDTREDVADTVDEDTLPDVTAAEITTPELTVPEVTVPPFTLPVGTQPPPGSTAPAGVASAIGSTAGLSAFDTSIDATLLSFVDPAPIEQFFDPEAGNRLVAVQLRLVNTGAAEYVDSPFSGSMLVDGAGIDHESSIVSTTLGPELFSVRILPGDVRTGWVTFELPGDTPAATFVWTTDSGFSEVGARWDLLAAPLTPSAAPAVVPGSTPIGTPVLLVGSSVQVTVTVTRVIDPATPADGFEPAEGKRLVAVEMTVQNTGSTTYDESPDSSTMIVDSLGQAEFSSYYLTRDGPQFDDFPQLAPGASMTGLISFELPIAATVVKLQMAADFGFADQLVEFALI